MLKYFYVDGEKFCECNDYGKPIEFGRAKRRVLKKYELEHEKLFLKSMDRSGFRKETSKSLKWLSKVFNSGKPSHGAVRAVAEVFSNLLDERLEREVYRRKETLLYWINDNIEKIAKICQQKKIFAISDDKKVYEFMPPNDSIMHGVNQTTAFDDLGWPGFEVPTKSKSSSIPFVPDDFSLFELSDKF